MNIEYTYEIVSVDEAARCMEVVYSAEGYPTMRIGARLPYEGEALGDVIESFTPVPFWVERATPVVVPQVGTVGDVVSVAGQLVATTRPTSLSDAARSRRDTELAKSDWSVLPDSPLDSAARAVWVEYRQLLRDVPRQSGFPDSIIWPTAPNQVPVSAWSRLAKILPQGVALTYVEVGVLRARNLVTMAGMYPLLQITGVDSYKAYTNLLRGNNGVSEALGAYNRQLAEKAIARCPDAGRINLVIEDSGVYAATVPDASLDVVFLDKCLCMDSQRQDVVDWYAKVKPGGIFCGHDAWTEDILNGVRQGLTEVGCHSQLEFIDVGVWFIRKGQ